MRVIMRVLLSILLVGAFALAADYTGPRPAKTDTLYLVHADNLIELEHVDSKQENKKNEILYSVPGTAATSSYDRVSSGHQHSFGTDASTVLFTG